MHDSARRILRNLVVIASIALSGWAEEAAAQDAAPADALAELIVLLDDSAGTPTAEAVVDASRRELPLPSGLGKTSRPRRAIVIEHRALMFSLAATFSHRSLSLVSSRNHTA